MNFIIKYRRSNLQSRRGMILLVVMAVLSFFAVMGMTFILMTGKNRDSAETAQLAAQNSKTAGNSPQELLEEGIMQVLVGPPKDGTTQSKNSALYECDLIGDMYGTVERVRTVVVEDQIIRAGYGREGEDGFFDFAHEFRIRALAEDLGNGIAQHLHTGPDDNEGDDGAEPCFQGETDCEENDRCG